MGPQMDRPSPPVAVGGFRGRLGEGARSFLRDESGAVLAVIALVIPAVIGLVSLSADGGRLMNLNTELQAIADAAAIAGAWELDGADDAIDRAIAAAMGTLASSPQNAPLLAMDGSGPQIDLASIQFFSCLEEEEGCLDLGGDVSTFDPTEAVYIKVTTVPRASENIFAPVLALAGQSSTSATATAGSTIVACNVQPLMMCNPYEPSGNEFSAEPGQMFIFKAKPETAGGGGTSFAPGDFALVDPPGETSSGATAVRDLLSLQGRKVCITNRLSPRSGHATNMVNWGVNVRFDLPPGGGQLNRMNQTPAPNVVKGMIGGGADGCNFQGGSYEEHPEARLPQDQNMTAYGAVRIGDAEGSDMSQAAMDQYWSYHHGAPWPTGGSAPTTRYEAYLLELEMLQSGWGRDPPNEQPAPRCAPHSNNTSIDEPIPERRIMNVAIVDCLRFGIRGNSVNFVRPDKYAEFFITEPASGGQIYTEFVRLMTPEDDESKIHRVVQLYRWREPK